MTQSLEGKFSSNWRDPVRKVKTAEDEIISALKSQQFIDKQKFFEITVDI